MHGPKNIKIIMETINKVALNKKYTSQFKQFQHLKLKRLITYAPHKKPIVLKVQETSLWSVQSSGLQTREMVGLNAHLHCSQTTECHRYLSTLRYQPFLLKLKRSNIYVH